MSIITIETTVTHKYLMNKSKSDLAYLYLGLLDAKEQLESRLAAYERLERVAQELADDYSDIIENEYSGTEMYSGGIELLQEVHDALSALHAAKL